MGTSQFKLFIAKAHKYCNPFFKDDNQTNFKKSAKHRLINPHNKKISIRKRTIVTFLILTYKSRVGECVKNWLNNLQSNINVIFKTIGFL